jgi:hypothetical protein
VFQDACSLELPYLIGTTYQNRKNRQNGHKKDQYFPLQDSPKFTKIGIFGLKIYNLASLFQFPVVTRPVVHWPSFYFFFYPKLGLIGTYLGRCNFPRPFQGDQIGRISAYWTIVFCGQDCKNCQRSPNPKNISINFDQYSFWATFWAIFSQTHPVTLSTSFKSNSLNTIGP